ncbi:MAG: hypothetical protein K6B68_02850 [Eubacterium sp.]|nr:hypothetical protein [Eubacterium sp.]
MGNGPSVSEEKLKLIAMMDQTLNGLDQRRRELNTELDSEQSEEQVARIKKDLIEIDNQMSAIKGAREEFEKQYAKAKTEEEKKELERVVKMAIIVGMTSESLRLSYERQKQLDADRESALAQMEALKAERNEKAIDRIFEVNSFRFITRDMVDEIKNNEKFKDMAENDPDRLNREALSKQDEYSAMIARHFYRRNIKMSNDFAENEKKLREQLMQENEFEKAVPMLKNFIDGNLNKHGGEEDKKFFLEIYKDLEELKVESRKIDNEFINNQSDFTKGNGITKEIIEKEKSLSKRLKDYIEKAMNLGEELANKDDEKAYSQYMLLQGALMIDGTIKGRLDEDEVKFRQNEFNKEKEGWQVFKQLSEDNTPKINEVSKKGIIENRALAKVTRLSNISRIESKESLLGRVADWAKDSSQEIINIIKNKSRITVANKNKIKEKVASIVLFQLVYNEQKQFMESRPFSGLVWRKYKDNHKLDEVAKQLASVPEFNIVYYSYMRGGEFKDKCIKFLAEDGEKLLAQQLGDNIIEVMKNQPIEEEKGRSRSKTYANVHAKPGNKASSKKKINPNNN